MPEDNNGEKRRLQEQIERLRDEKIDRLERTLEKYTGRCESNAVTVDERLRALENSYAQMVGIGIAGKYVIPAAISFLTAIAVKFVTDAIFK